MNVKTAEFVSDVEVRDTVLQDAKNTESRGKTKNIPIDLCYVKDNPREDHKIGPIVESMKRHGYMLNQPVTAVEDSDGKFLIVRGNRRLLAVEEIRKNDPETFAVLFSKGTIPAVVYKKTSAQEIALLRIDFDNTAEREPLNAWEQFLAVRVLVKAGYHTEEGIAAKMGMYVDDQPARSWAQNRVRLAKLPVEAQNLFRTVFLKTKENTLRIGDISHLAKVYRAGNQENFEESLKERANREVKPKSDGIKVKFALTPNEIRDRMNSFDSEIMRRILASLIGDAEELTTIDSELCELVAKADAVTDFGTEEI